MGYATGIEWASHTWSPWIGCTNVSAGCDNCYAETMMAKRLHFVEWGNAPRRRTAENGWREVRKWNRKAADERRICFPSLCDPFDNQAPDEWRDDLWSLIADTPALTWTLLTKRPQNIRKMLPDNWGDGWPNVWLGVTTENQTEADRRIPMLQSIPAVVRFLSAEPLLEPIAPDLAGIHWVICGCESGSQARPCDLDWIRSLRDQCSAAGSAFFLKQAMIDHELVSVPMLEGRQWVEFPQRPA